MAKKCKDCRDAKVQLGEFCSTDCKDAWNKKIDVDISGIVRQSQIRDTAERHGKYRV